MFVSFNKNSFTLITIDLDVSSMPKKQTKIKINQNTNVCPGNPELNSMNQNKNSLIFIIYFSVYL